MATEQENQKNSKLEYLDLVQFAKAKNDTHYLRNYTKLDNIKETTIVSLISDEEIKSKQDELMQIEVAQKEIQKQKLLDKQLLEKRQRDEDKAKEHAEKEASIRKLESDKEADEKAKVEQRLSSGIDFSDAQDYKRIERAIKGFEKTDENIEILIECISNVYPDLNAKATKQFNTKSKEIVKWLGKERFEELLKKIK